MHANSETTTQPCPCGRAKTYSECCYRFISGKALAKTPEQLMRSRYSAHALGGKGEYLLKTWFPITARGLTAEELSQKKYRWLKLEVLDKQQHGDEGSVEFKAHYQLTTDGQSGVLHEISEFKRIANQWFYVGGRVGNIAKH